MDIFVTALGYLLIFLVTPVATFHIVGRLNPYLSKKFPISQEEQNTIDALLSEENPNREKYNRYGLIEIFIFIVPFAFFLMILPLLHIIIGQNDPGVVMKFHVVVSFFIASFPAMFLGVALSAYISNWLIRLIYRVFNPQDDSSVLYYTSRIMTPATAGYRGDYHPRSGNRFMFLFFLGIYPIFSYLAHTSVDVLTSAHFTEKGIFIDKNYDVRELNFDLYIEKPKHAPKLRITQKTDNTVLLDTSVRTGELQDLKHFLADVK